MARHARRRGRRARRLAEVDDVDTTRVATSATRPAGTSRSGSPRATGSRPAPPAPAHACGPSRPSRRQACSTSTAAHEEGSAMGRSRRCSARPTRDPDRYAAASPAALAPLGVDQLLVHGTADDVVPVTQSRIHAALDPRARARRGRRRRPLRRDRPRPPRLARHGRLALAPPRGELLTLYRKNAI